MLWCYGFFLKNNISLLFMMTMMMMVVIILVYVLSSFISCVYLVVSVYCFHWSICSLRFPHFGGAWSTFSKWFFFSCHVLLLLLIGWATHFLVLSPQNISVNRLTCDSHSTFVGVCSFFVHPVNKSVAKLFQIMAFPEWMSIEQTIKVLHGSMSQHAVHVVKMFFF